jgi:hypothetical protein
VIALCPLHYIIDLAAYLLIALRILLKRLHHFPSGLQLVIMAIGLIPTRKVIIPLPHIIIVTVIHLNIEQIPTRNIIPIFI